MNEKNGQHDLPDTPRFNPPPPESAAAPPDPAASPLVPTPARDSMVSHPGIVARRWAELTHHTRPEAQIYALQWARETHAPELKSAHTNLALLTVEQQETDRELERNWRSLESRPDTGPGKGPGIPYPLEVWLRIIAILSMTAAALGAEVRNIAGWLHGTMPGVESITDAALYAATCVIGTVALKSVYEQLDLWWKRRVLVTAAVLWVVLFVVWAVTSAQVFARYAADPTELLMRALDGSRHSTGTGDLTGIGAVAAAHPAVMIACMFLMIPLTSLLGVSYYFHVSHLYGPPEVPDQFKADYRSERASLQVRRLKLMQASAAWSAYSERLQAAIDRVVRESLEAWDRAHFSGQADFPAPPDLH